MKIFVYSGTHWDREWYESFQGFRSRLVEMADALLDGLDRRGDYNVFHFDGQTIVLEDILEIAPDLENRMKKYIQNGKIQIGPWYCMPDEFIISGESLIRNLQIGKEICHKWGVEPNKEGYICDIFGHIAQMPQIFDGMDIHHTVLGRGTNEHTTPMHFRWQSPDGTEVIAFKLDDVKGYGDFSQVAPRTNGLAEGASEEELIETIKPYVDERLKECNAPVLLLLDACDHNNWHADTPVYVETLKKLYPEAEVYHANIMDFCSEVDKYASSLPVRTGELNETSKKAGGYVHLITNVLSSRYNLKKYNDTLQTELEKIVAPIYAYGKAATRDGFLKLAQKYLIQNHPHDSICGCSIDQVHRDMVYRFDQSKMICGEIMKRVMGRIRTGAFADTVSVREDSHPSKILRIYNPLPYRVHKMIETEVHFPKSYPKFREPFGYENVCRFKLYDADGREIRYGIKDIEIHGNRDIYKLAIEADLIPTGLTDIEVREEADPTRYLGALSNDTYTAENEFIELTVSPADATISILDKKTGRIYPSLLTLTDDGEIGDGWYHCNPKTDRTVMGTFVSCEKCENNVNSVTFRINVELKLPAEMEFQNFGIRRSESYITVPVSHYVTLYRTERYVSVRTVVDNKAMDHRLKLRLGTGIEGGRYSASQAFTMVERDCDYDMNTADWKETGSAEKATEGIVVKRGENCGLAFMSRRGLHECAVYSNGNMDITLLRCYRKTKNTEGEFDGEMLGVHEFEYLVMPVDDSDSAAELYRISDAFRVGVIDTTVESATGMKYESGLEILGDTFVFTTANKTEDGMEFRFFNCSDNDESGDIVLPASMNAKSAEKTYIDGRFIESVALDGNRITVSARKWEIVTVRVHL